MPRAATQNYITEAAKLATSPQFFVRFFWVDSNGTSYQFSRDLADGTIASATNDPMTFLDDISGNTQSVEPQSGQSSIGQITLRVSDGNGSFAKYMSNPQLPLGGALNNTSTADIGITGDVSGYPSKGTITIDDERIRYTSLDEINDRFSGIVRGVDGTSAAAHNAGSRVHNGEEIRPKTRVQIFGGYRTLGEPDFASIAVFDVSTRSFDAKARKWTIALTDLQRFMKRRLFLDATQDQPVVRTGNPITLLLETLLTSGTAGKNHATYDLGNVERGADIPLGLVDVDGLEFLRNTFFANDSYTFNIFAPVEAKQWVQNELFLAMNLVPVVTADGKYSARRMAAPALKGLGSSFLGQDELGVGEFVTDGFVSGAAAELGAFELGAVENASGAAVHLTETDIIDILSWEHGDSNIVNRVAFTYDHGLDGDPGFITRQTFKANLSRERFGEKNPVVIESKGIKTTSNGQEIVDDRAYFLFKRYAEPPPILTLTCFYRNNRIELLDVILITHSDIPDPSTGLFGVTSKRFEVIDITPKFGFGGALQLTLLSIDDYFPQEFEDIDPKFSVSSLTRDVTPPSVPVGLSATSTTTRDGTTGAVVSRIESTWTANTESDLSHYVIKLTEIDGFKFSEQIVLAPDTTALFEGVSTGVNYNVAISAVDQAGNASAFSSAFAITAATNTDSVGNPTVAPVLITGTSTDPNNGTSTAFIQATAATYAGNDLDHIVFKLKKTADTWTNWIDKQDSDAEDSDGVDIHRFNRLELGVSYDVKYKYKTKRQNGTVGSDWSPTATIVAGVDATAPAVVTNVSASAAFKTISVIWDNPSDIRFDTVEVWRNSVDNNATATKIADGIRIDSYFDDRLDDPPPGSPYGVTRYYWIKSVSRTGAVSGFHATGGASATTLQIDTADYKNLSIVTAAIGNLQVDDAKIANLNGSKITVGTVTSDKLFVSTISSIATNMGTVSSGKFQNHPTVPTMTIDMTAGKITVNAAGGLQIDALDGVKITNGACLFFNTSGSIGWRLSPVSSGNVLEVTPTGTFPADKTVRLGVNAVNERLDQLFIDLENTNSEFQVDSNGATIFTAGRNASGQSAIGFFTASKQNKITVSGPRDNPENALKDLLQALEDYGLITDTTTVT